MNNDNKLDAVEYAAFNSPEEFQHMHEILVRQMLARRDHNKDGVIDFNEFITDERGERLDPNSEQYLSEKDKFYNQYDLNHDQKLDFNECINWIVPNNTYVFFFYLFVLPYLDLMSHFTITNFNCMQVYHEQSYQRKIPYYFADCSGKRVFCLLSFWLVIFTVFIYNLYAYREIAENEAIHLITSADVDHDGKLSVNEIVDSYEVFVGSEATQFGRSLNTHAVDELWLVITKLIIL